MEVVSFTPRWRVVGDELPVVNESVIKDEPMLFSCDWDFAHSHGGTLTRLFLDSVPPEWAELRDAMVIDSRVHMLMKGWYPAIPGWHLDDVPRTRDDGQPDHVRPSYYARNLMALWNADVAPTEFILGREFHLIDVPPGQGVVYGKWHDDIETLIHAGELRTMAVPDRRYVDFGWGDFHQATPAVRFGWRFFIRANVNTTRKKRNEIRRQVQVYMTKPFRGW